MQIVPTAHMFPGACVLTGNSDGPFLDTQREIITDGRAFIRVAFVEEMALACGLPTKAMFDEVVQSREEAEKRADALAADVEKLTERLAGLELLRESVAYTLENGAVFDADGKPKVRTKPGQKRTPVDALIKEVDEGRLHRSILEDFDRARESMDALRARIDELTAPIQQDPSVR